MFALPLNLQLIQHSHDHARGRVDNGVVSVDDPRNHSALSRRRHRVDRSLPARVGRIASK